jgi:curved DNA-binding protein CbpA
VLDVSPDATEQQILAAYRRKAKAVHPDAGGSSESFAQVTQSKGHRARNAEWQSL